MSSVEMRLRERVSVLEEEVLTLRAALIVTPFPWRSLRLPPILDSMFAALMKHDRASIHLLATICDLHCRSAEGRDDNAVHANVARLRRRLSPHGIEIQNCYGYGWMLPEAAKIRVRAICGAQP